MIIIMMENYKNLMQVRLILHTPTPTHTHYILIDTITLIT